MVDVAKEKKRKGLVPSGKGEKGEMVSGRTWSG